MTIYSSVNYLLLRGTNCGIVLIIACAMATLCIVVVARHSASRAKMKAELEEQIAKKRELVANLERLKAKADRRKRQSKKNNENKS